MRVQTCRNCIHYAPDPNDQNGDHGECRRYPPTVTSITVAAEAPIGMTLNWTGQKVVPDTAWPEVIADDWCGQWTYAGEAS